MKYELIITARREESFKIEFTRSLQGDNLIAILAVLPLAIAELKDKLHEQEKEELGVYDDDIPF